ncbi:MAG: hypothetical protein KatS3mg126_1847 [Lysobacteraceae bacterium]|nr:MAG: hypothetical protein KatS3mg126_1847 [Xanthomonadaceae bacterium]
MLDQDDDSALLRRQKQFLQQVEFELRRINRRIIHEHIPELNRDRFVALAGFVAEIRSRYLRAALALSAFRPGSAEAEDALAALERERRSFEECVAAFAALERAIEQGYVDIQR